MARAGSQSQFEQAAEDLHCYAGLSVEARFSCCALTSKR